MGLIKQFFICLHHLTHRHDIHPQFPAIQRAIRGVTDITGSNDILPLPDWAYEEIIFGAASSYLQGYSGLLAPSTNQLQNAQEDKSQKGYRPESKDDNK